MTVKKKNTIFYVSLAFCIVVLLILIGAVSSGTFNEDGINKSHTLIEDEGMNSSSLPISAIEVTKENEVLQNENTELKKQIKDNENITTELNNQIKQKDEKLENNQALVSAYVLFLNGDTENAKNKLSDVTYEGLNDDYKKIYELIK